MRYFICLLALLIALPTSAQVYTYIDENGERVFTDSPPKGQKTQTVNIAPRNTNTLAAPAKPAAAIEVQQLAPPAEQSVQAYSLLRILTPEPDASVRANDRSVLVTITSEPSLQANHQFRLIMDGKITTSSSSPVIQVNEVDRGSHMIAVEIIDQHGLIIERTPSQPFHLKQTTLADKRRVKPCAYKEFGVRPECPLKDKPAKDPDKPPILSRILGIAK